MTQKQTLLFIGIILVAVFFRFYQIDQMPGGLFPDEAANGLDINLMQQGQLQPFYERGNGREALFFYMEWASVAVFGKGFWQHDIVSALIGLLSVMVCFLVTKKLFMMDLFVGPDAKSLSDNERHRKKNRATNIALLAAFLMAVSTWHIVLSRTAFRAVLIPLFSGLTFYFLLSTYQSLAPSFNNSEKLVDKLKKKRNAYIYAFLAGASFALGFYTYIAFRIMAPILFMVLLWPLLVEMRDGKFWTTIKSYKLPIISFVLAFIIFIFPIARYFIQHPASFVGRAGQVSVFNPELYTINGEQLHGTPPLSVILPVIGEVLKIQMLGFFTQGDLNWRSNISGFPFLSALISPFFGAGLIVVIILGILYFFAPKKYAKWWKFYLLTGWFTGMLLPVLTTAEGIPHGLRGIGVIPVVFIITAWTLYEFVQLFMKLHKKMWQHHLFRHKDPQWMKENHFIPLRMRLVNWALKLLAVCFCLALILQTYYMYFVYAAASPENYFFFRSDLTSVSQYLVKRCDKEHTYLVLDTFYLQTTDYLTSDSNGDFNSPCNVPYQKVNPADTWQLKNLKPGDEIVFTESTVFDAKKFKQFHRNAHLRLEKRNKFGQSIMAVYEVTGNN